MGSYDAVLFDWMLTLAEYPDERDHVRRAQACIGREKGDEHLDSILARLQRAAIDPEVLTAYERADCSPALHRAAEMLLYERAEIDPALASTMYDLIGDPSFHPLYPEARSLLEGLADRDIRVAVVSDIHVDLRVHADVFDVAHLVDTWVLSFEHGVQKPDPAIFQVALDALGIDPSAALMVGDRASHDGAATALGIDTLIFPPVVEENRRSRRMQQVLRLVEA